MSRTSLPRWASRAAAAASVTAVAAVATVACGSAAQADENPRGSHNGPRVGLVNTGQIDDPAEDVLEHTLLFGDNYRWI